MKIELYKGTCVIVDDELRSRNNLALFIRDFLPGLEILGLAESADSARKILKEHKPDILFLDVQMPGEDGFELLESLDNRDFALIFVTAFEKYALRAIKVSAIDYIVKPIDTADLQKATLKGLELRNSKGKEVYKQSVDQFLEHIETREFPKEITLPHKGSFVIREIDKIKCLEADNNYTNFVFENDEKILVAKTMKYYDEVLDPKQFIRCSRSVIVNCKYLDTFRDTSVVLKGGPSYTISRRKKKAVLEVFDNYLNNK